MKTMTCRQLAGACDLEFHADTFVEMGELSKKHAMEMVEKGDSGHIKKMEEMNEFMKKPEERQAWFDKKQKEFDELPED